MRYPIGFRARIRDDVRRIDGRLLVGGSPLRAVRLTRAALALLADGEVTVVDAVTDALAARLVDGNLADPVLDGPGVEPAELTVVIPVRDRPEQLDRALSSLGALHRIVVDDASLDPEAVARVAHRHGAHLVQLTRNVGPAGARNAGLRAVRTRFVAFVDSDVTVEASTLLNLTRHFADSRVALVAPLVRSRARSREPRWFERFDEDDSSLALGTRACVVRPGAAVGWLPSACLVGRTERLGAGFEETMRVGEDVDLVWRLVEAGEVVRYDPEQVAWHDTRTTVSGWLGRKYLYGTGGADLAVRHGRKGAPAVMTASMAATAAALLVRRRWSLPVAAAGIAYGVLSLRRRLPETPGRDRLAVQLCAQGLGWTVRQEAALLLRHWWPLTVLLAPRSALIRRALAASLVVDVVVAQVDNPGTRYRPLARRLDDMAYGAGLWAGAIRARSVTCLLPRRPGQGGTSPNG
ncbi:mycofactocin biosynthesis glycosyltransferase MftF [Nocardioides luteus]|uniref:Mycofactocin system glycosyltransferase n=1 Tax=Nocardioides luteus TaxID=1844 RepID=A0A1J4N2V2_9ACTN|nr:mycofactocin biosynthesis glycosyltransferase MftF [Nocardioides luteus]OIJ25287.1 mycofactocin system glycosyltransferase [Nocardioides luteus]